MFGRQPSVIHLELEAIKNGLADESMLIIDVREPHEYAAGHIPGSLSLPLSQFDVAQLEQNKGKRLVFSCAAGVRSIKALELAQAAGFPLKEHYRGGFKEWAGMGEPVEV
jgi:rhodanese-related sulfurtransferase